MPVNTISVAVVNQKLANSINLESGCANPTQLETTPLINTAASISLLTTKAPANNLTTTDVHITILQPSGDKMTSTLTIDLLLQLLPPEACLAYRLPGLINNLLLVAVLFKVGCKVFFHKNGCEVTLDRATILRGWHDPKNKLWRVKIVDDGWTTKLTICDDTNRLTVSLSTPPTVFAPSAHATTTNQMGQANSLYKCANTHQ
jgi:hypothetical protein